MPMSGIHLRNHKLDTLVARAKVAMMSPPYHFAKDIASICYEAIEK